MKTLTAIALATTMTFAGGSFALAQGMDFTAATSEQIAAATTAQIVEADDAIFDASKGMDLPTIRMATSQNTAFATLFENSEYEPSDIIAVSVGEDGVLTFYVDQNSEETDD